MRTKDSMTDAELSAVASEWLGLWTSADCPNDEGYETFSGVVPSVLPPVDNGRCSICGHEDLVTAGKRAMRPHLGAPPPLDSAWLLRALGALTERQIRWRLERMSGDTYAEIQAAPFSWFSLATAHDSDPVLAIALAVVELAEREKHGNHK